MVGKSLNDKGQFFSGFKKQTLPSIRVAQV